jgi:hypothetical protein
VAFSGIFPLAFISILHGWSHRLKSKNTALPYRVTYVVPKTRHFLGIFPLVALVGFPGRRTPWADAPKNVKSYGNKKIN